MGVTAWRMAYYRLNPREDRVRHRKGATVKVAIRDIIVDPTIQIRRSNREQTIQRYEEAFDKLPPVDVFETSEGLLLADGFHRVAAARRLGIAEIEANVRKGTREEAAEHAVIANTKNGEPLTADERNAGVRRLKQLHPGWSLREIADAMSIGAQTVSNIIRVDEVRREVFTPSVNVLTDRHIREVAKAPSEQREPLIEAAAERNWSSEATALAVQNLRDDRIPLERKRDILAGKADPVVVTPEGQLAVPAEIVGRQIREMAANDAVLAFESALEHLAKLRLFRPEAIVSTIGRRRLDQLIGEVPGYVDFLNQVLAAARIESRKLEVVHGEGSNTN